MPRLAAVLGLVAAVLLAANPLASATLDYRRVHLVDHSPAGSGFNNFLFRGNMPTNTSSDGKPFFDYDTLISYMRERAEEAGLTLPDEVYMIDISLNNPFDGPDFWAEEAFWKNASPSVGKFINWPLGLAGVLPPTVYPVQKRYEMANSTVWKWDKLPSRIPFIRSLLSTTFPKPAVVYVHCTAGCDRTGEVIGAYRMLYETQNLTKMYALDTYECGRPPNYFSTGALEWFCYYYEDTHHMEDIGNCVGFATCKPFGHCTPTGTNVVVDEEAGPTSSLFHERIVAATGLRHRSEEDTAAQQEEIADTAAHVCGFA